MQHPIEINDMKTEMKCIRNLLLLLLLSILLFSLNCMATCTPQGAYTAPVTLQGGTFSAGAEMATGSVIRIQRVNGYRDSYTACSGPTYMTYTATGGTLYSGQTYIYQTGVSGLGVRFKNIDSGVYHGTSGRGSGWNGTIAASRFSVNVEFVKMGPITAGQVNTSLFPTIAVVTNDSSGGVSAATYRFSGGSFTVQTPTCTTPNYTYSLGSWLTTESSNNSASNWVDTPVILTNCPIFYGNNSNGSYSNYTITNLNGGGSATNSGALAPNTLQMKLTPNTSVIDAVNGIVSVDSNASAQGVAVQVGNKQSGTYIVQNLNNTMTVTTDPNNSATMVRFPLGARMVKTGSPVKAGSISTSLTYTITYQ